MFKHIFPNVLGSKLLVLGMVIQPLIGNPCNGYINPYYWVDDHPLLYENNGSLAPSTSGNYHDDLRNMVTSVGKKVRNPPCLFFSLVLTMVMNPMGSNPVQKSPKKNKSKFFWFYLTIFWANFIKHGGEIHQKSP